MTSPRDPFFDLVAAGDIAVVTAMLDHDPQLLNKTTESGANALHFAAPNGHSHIIRLLVERGLDPNLCNRDGWSPLWIAVMLDNTTQGMQALLEMGADPNLSTEGGGPLYDAVRSLDKVRLLLDHAVDPNLPIVKGHAPLHHAVELMHQGRSEPAVVLALVGAGADPNFKLEGATETRTPVELARHWGYASLADEMQALYEAARAHLAVLVLMANCLPDVARPLP